LYDLEIISVIITLKRSHMQFQFINYYYADFKWIRL